MEVHATVPERCLLYLLERAAVEEGSREAEQLVQDRISQALAVRRAHVSRAMLRLQTEGLVTIRKVHVRGENRRLNGYWLTHSGLQRAKDLRNRIEESAVLVKDFQGVERTMRLFEVPRMFAQPPRLSDVLAAVERGRLDLSDLQDRQTRLRGRLLYDVEGPLTGNSFVGREAELARLRRFLQADRGRGFLLVGLPGIGKTALASRFVSTLRQEYHILWRRVRTDLSLPELLEDLGAALRAIGRPSLSELIRDRTSLRGDPVRLLGQEGLTLRLLLVLDDAHNAQADIRHFLENLLDDSIQSRLKLLLLSRHVLQLSNPDLVVQGRLQVFELSDLSPTDANDLLVTVGMSPSRREGLLRLCGGHPLSLGLAAASGIPIQQAHAISSDWLARECLANLDSRTEETLRLVAVFGDPVPRDYVLRGLDELLRRCLVREVEGDRIDAHELVRSAALQGLQEEVLARLHSRAGDLLATSGDARNRMAALRHYVEAGDTRGAHRVIVTSGELLISAGLAEGLVDLGERVDHLVGTSDAKAEGMRLLHGHALFASGRWRQAARVYEGLTTSRNRATAAEAMLGYGKSESRRGSQRALTLLLRARDHLERRGALHLLAEAEYWIGGAYEDSGREQEAMDAYQRGRAIAFDIGDRRWEGLCAYGVGRMHSLRGEYDIALREELKALQLVERAGYRLDAAKVCVGIGGNLSELDRLDEAETYLSRAVSEARATGSQALLSSSLYNLAVVMKHSGKLQDAVGLWREALDAYENLEQHDRAAWCAAWLAEAEWTNNRPEEALALVRRAEELIRLTPEPALRARAFRHLARAALKGGHGAEATRALSLALEEALLTGSTALEGELSRELRTLAGSA